MEVIIRPTTQEAVHLTARLIADAINAKPEFKLGLATGATMEAVYADLAAMNQRKEVDFSLVKTFNLDEYIGLPPEDKNSYRYYMNHHLFSRINIDMRNTNLPDGMAKDEIAEGERYEAAIRDCGGIDLQLLGIGPNGHIGFNEPGEAFELETHCVDLTPETIEANKRFFDGNVDLVPKQAYTMGIKTIMQARKVLMVANGKGKAEIVKKAFFGPVTPEVPASILQMHPDFTLVGDEEALSLI